MIRRKPCVPLEAVDVARGLDAWYRTPAGRAVRAQLHAVLDPLLQGVFGYHAVLIGAGGLDRRLLRDSPIKRAFLIATVPGAGDVVAAPEELPVQSDSVDLVVLFHALEYSADPHRVLREVDRMLIPEGQLIVVGFNPWSRFGLWRLMQRRRAPWCGSFYSSGRIRDWLALLGFELKSVHVATAHGHAAGSGARHFAGALLGALHIHHAIKRVATLTPLRAAWRATGSLLPGNAPEPTLSQPKAARAGPQPPAGRPHSVLGRP